MRIEMHVRRVRPSEVAKQSSRGNVRVGLFHSIQLLEVVELGRQPRMNAEEDSIQHRRKGEELEGGEDQAEDLLVILGSALPLEIVPGSEVVGLVVASKQEDAIRKLKLHHENREEDLDSEIAAVDVVSEKQVASGHRGPSVLQNVVKVPQLTVNVSDQGHRVFEEQQIGFSLWSSHLESE